METNETQKTALIPLIALIFAAITLTAVTAGVLTAHQNVPTSVKVDGKIFSTIDIGVDSNPEATVNCTNVDWGSLNQGSTATKTIYIKNTGNISESLKMITINWNPSFSRSPLALTLSQEGTI